MPDALGRVGADWAKFLVIAGACSGKPTSQTGIRVRKLICHLSLAGMVTVLMGTMYALTRIVYAMADDGLLFSWMSRVNDKTQLPLKAMYCFASLGAIFALFLEIDILVEMMSIGTLLAYLVVSASVIIIR